MTTFTWSITNLITVPKLNGQNNVVTALSYQVLGNNGTNTASYQRNMSVNYISGLPFTSFSSLTEAEVIGWVQKNLGKSAITNIENYVQEKLNEIASPITVATPQKLPWAN